MSENPSRCSKKIKKRRLSKLQYVPGFLLKLYDMVSVCFIYNTYTLYRALSSLKKLENYFREFVPIIIFRQIKTNINQTPDNRDSIEFTAKGDAFVVKNEKLLADEILPAQFKHKNFSSFVRQLNMYGFKKIRNVDNQNEFRHKYFLKYEKNQLSKIFRKNGPKLNDLDIGDDRTELCRIGEQYDSLKSQLNEAKKCNELLTEVNQSFSDSTLVFIVAQQQLKQEVQELRSRSTQWNMISEVLVQMILARLPQNNRQLSIQNVEQLRQFYNMETKGPTINSSSNSNNSDPDPKDDSRRAESPRQTRSRRSAPDYEKRQIHSYHNHAHTTEDNNKQDSSPRD